MLPKFNPKGKNPENLCELCKDDCTSAGRFANYHGAFKCMAEGYGDVAFVKHTTVKEVVTDNPSLYGKADDYSYLCPDGSRKGINLINCLSKIGNFVPTDLQWPKQEKKNICDFRTSIPHSKSPNRICY